MDFIKVKDINLTGINSEEEYEAWYASEKADGFYLFYLEGTSDITLYFSSSDKSIRALEFLDFVINEYGFIKGDKNNARGVVSQSVMQAEFSDMDVESLSDFLIKRIEDYYQECEWIYVSECPDDYFMDIQTNPIYVKKKIPWAMVKTADIVSPGEILSLKTLENESGLDIVAEDDTYIMIGIKGEVYHIQRDVFESAYNITDEKLDIFTSMMDFIPEVYHKSIGEYITIDESAKICYPKSGNGIYVQILSARTKVFTSRDSEYFVGKRGDILAARREEPRDMYIIQRDVFERTYECV